MRRECGWWDYGYAQDCGCDYAEHKEETQNHSRINRRNTDTDHHRRKKTKATALAWKHFSQNIGGGLKARFSARQTLQTCEGVGCGLCVG